MSIKTCILLLGVVVCLSSQASSLKCYQCGSDSVGDCFTNPKKKEFEKHCEGAKFEFANSEDSHVVFALNELMSNYTRSTGYSNDDSAFECGTLKLSLLSLPDSKLALRGCYPTSISCKVLEFGLGQKGIVIERCTRCTTDLCNEEQL